ncbi:diguanylate cyclase [Grimontia sp. AD028]|uniref:GGDEF domain-containing protein n=1 Tax=Grimontia sp. AD028 TaxID=1581149 RepID=UPI00061B20B0|nr:GGDEF domain-containing protein [Grimontia sp. AD028]KKD60387.1 diguanylate cyclase [Grimontia sp. AD028]
MQKTLKNLLFFFVIFTGAANASVEKTQSFEKTLNGVQSILYSVPIKARALLSELEKVELKQNQPLPLLVRYYLQKSTVDLLLNDPESAVLAANTGIELAKNDPLLKADLYLMQLRLGQARILKGEEALVLDQLDTLLAESQTLNDPSVTAEILLVKGQAYKAQNDYDVSMAALMSSLEAAKTTQDALLVERIASSLGGILVQLNGFDKASLLLDQSYQFFRERKMSFNQLLVKLDMAELAKKQGDKKQALLEYKQALQIAQVLGDGSHRFRINLQIADLLLQSGDTKSMGRYLKQTDALRDRETIRYYISKYNYLKANENLLNENFQGAIDLVTPLIAGQADLTRLYRTEIELYLVASKAHFGMEDYKNAYLTLLDYQNRFNNFSADEQVDNLERQQMLFNLEKLKAENQHLSWNNVLQTLELKTNEDKVEYLNVLVVAGVMATVLATLAALWINRRRARWGKIANTDSLTGLYNRRYLSTQLDKLKAEMESNGEPIGCMLLDVDHFKKVNDTYGHPVGDKVLTGIAELFKNNLRRNDVCSRVGGEEFMLLLPNSQLEQAQLIAEDLRTRISELAFLTEQGDEFNVTASFGVSSVEPGQSLSDIYSEVDKLLYLAKQNGRNRVESSGLDNTERDATQSVQSSPSMSDKFSRLGRGMRRLKFRFAQHFS